LIHTVIKPLKGDDSMLDKLALTIAIIGGLNWGSIGLFQFDLVAWICGGADALLARIIYTVVGLSAVWCISLLFRETDSVRSHTRV
jgi:uncharacterized membrane protein YuzA (DUF378 family)